MEEKRTEVTNESTNTPAENTANNATESTSSTSLADQILAQYAAESKSESVEPEPVTSEPPVEASAEAQAPAAEVEPVATPVAIAASEVVVESAEEAGTETEVLAEEEAAQELNLEGLDKKGLADLLEQYIGHAYSAKNDAAIRTIKDTFDQIEEGERRLALDKFIAEGGEEEGFEFKRDGTSIRFNNAVKQYRERRRAEAVEAEKSKERNQARKLELLDLLRQLVESDEEVTSLDKLKKIEEEWKSIGPVPNTFAQEIRSNYAALRNLFYDRRSIYFELKELDRKKNLEAKLGLTEKAKALLDEKSLNKAIKELNDLHEEWRNIGPVPKDEQEKIWADFKTVSDEIYSRRRNYLEKLKVEQTENLQRKNILIEKSALLSSFKAENFNDWNAKTQEVMKLEEEWKTIGNVPADKAGDVNRTFWSNIKNFFNNKHGFFKALDKEKAQNLSAKTALCAEAEALQDSEDWEAAANALKDLQAKWKNIGPVPAKNREAIYERFKKAVDHFFERRRQLNEETEKSYEANLVAKKELLAKLEASTKAGQGSPEEIIDLLDQFNAIGYVPRKSIDTLAKDAARITEAYLDALKDVNPTELIKLKVAVHSKVASRGRNDGGFDRRERGAGRNNQGGGNNRGPQREDNSLRGMERNLRNRVQALENQIHSYENNLSFFANSRNVDSLRKEVEGKVKQLHKELADVRDQLKLVQQGIADEGKEKAQA